jgi:peptidoglycan/LPS O-acetylase OafA/YrhL
MSAERSKISAYIPEIDGLRAIACLMVFFHHCSVHLAWWMAPIANRGWSGVDLFFVLSGFLVTRILVESKGSNRYFLNFYARRILRIWPVYFLLLLFAFGVFPQFVAHWASLARVASTWDQKPFWVYGLFAQNLWRPGVEFPLVTVTWSLAIEEQFYLVWPLLVFLLQGRTRVAVLFGMFFAGIALRAEALSLHIPSYISYKVTPFHMDGLILGSLLAIWFLWPNARRGDWFLKSGVAAATIGGIASVWLLPDKLDFDVPMSPFLYSALALCFAGILASVVTHPVRWLTNHFLRYTGKISFCLYLVHYPVLMVLQSSSALNLLHQRFRPITVDFIVVIGGLAASYVLASASWYWVESPVLELKRHFSAPNEQPTTAVTLEPVQDLQPL